LWHGRKSNHFINDEGGGGGRKREGSLHPIFYGGGHDVWGRENGTHSFLRSQANGIGWGKKEICHKPLITGGGERKRLRSCEESSVGLYA